MVSMAFVHELVQREYDQMTQSVVDLCGNLLSITSLQNTAKVTQTILK